MSIVIYDRYKVEPIFPQYRGSFKDGSFHGFLPAWKGRKGRRSKSKLSGRRPNFALDQGSAPGHDCDVSDLSLAKLSTNRGLPDLNKGGGKHYASLGESQVAASNDRGESNAAGDIRESGKRVWPIPAIPVEPRRPHLKNPNKGAARVEPIPPPADSQGAGGKRKLSPFISATPTPNDPPGAIPGDQGDLLAHKLLTYCDEAGDAYGVPGDGVGMNINIWL